MSVKYSQRKAILEHLKNNSVGITSIEAFNLYGITRLSSIIHNLRKEGHIIVSNELTTTNRYGHTVRYSRYTLIERSES